jgi:hypothetical protein
MLILVVVPLVAGIESLFAKREDGRAISILSGVCIGGLLWNVYSDWRIWPMQCIVLLVLAAVPLVRLIRAGGQILREGLIAAAVTLAVVLAAWQGLLSFVVNAEVVTELEVRNAGGSAGTALVTYHPGRSSFQEMLVDGFAEGLESNGWHVDIATASKEAPTDLSGYDLLVLSAPTYDWAPAKPIQRYLQRLGDLGGQPTVVIISAAGIADLSLPMMEDLVREAKGDLVASHTLLTIVPNRLEYGIDDPAEIMRREATAILLPGE